MVPRKNALILKFRVRVFFYFQKEKGDRHDWIKKVNKIYNNKVHALKDINLKVEKGDIYGIIGYSGAGKSTLVRLLNGLEVATDGEVIIDGEDFNKITEETTSF